MTMQRLWPHFAQLGDGFAGGFGTDLYDPVWLRCLELVVSELQGLAGSGVLEEIAEASIVAAELPSVAEIFGAAPKGSAVAYPGIIVWPFQQEQHDPAGGPNDRDEITYPVAISFVDKGAGVTGTDSMVRSRAARRKHMLWREKASRLFRHGTWPTITEIRESNVRYQLYAIPEQYRSADLFHGAIVVDFIAWETRDS
jgi:hypothetical protein